MPKLGIFVQVLTPLFFIDTGCAIRSGQRLSTGSTGAPYNDRMPTHTLAEPFGTGQQHVQNIGKPFSCLFTENWMFLAICVCLWGEILSLKVFCWSLYLYAIILPDDFRTTYAKVLIPVSSTVYYHYVFCCPGYKEGDIGDDGSTPGSALCVRK